MKRKIVLWGHNEKDEKILVALELIAKDNKVNIYTFNEEIATEEFYNSLMDKWRLNNVVEFPDGFNTIERPLSVTENLLPDTIKVQRTDLISRAKAEWHFVVLSSKLYELYGTELEDLKDRISKLKEYDNEIWEEMKSFWSKVQAQIFENNLFKKHGEKLKEQTNSLFSQMKELKTKANAELEKLSKERFNTFSQKLDEISEKVEKGLGLSPIFDELKKLQNEFKNGVFTRSDRSKLWKKIDDAFKVVKEKKYGKPSPRTGNASRLQRRYDGLLSAVEKMERSIARDQKDIDFQSRKANETDGQLEMQIRQAKAKMVQERINSKNDKLAEMLATKKELELKLEKEKLKDQKIEEKKKIEKVKDAVKEKIAHDIKEKSESLSEEEKKLRDAAEAINEMPHKKKGRKKESMISAISTTVGEAIEDVVDTVKAVSEVVGEKVEEKLEETKGSIDVEEKVDQMKEIIEEVKDKVNEAVEDIKATFNNEQSTDPESKSEEE